jgi:hypothetical protein
VKVAPDELTGTEQAVLLVLMAECRPVRNPELKNLGPELKKDYRERLQRHGLIDVKAGSPMVLELTDDGWALCRALFGVEAPIGVRGQNKTLYTLMKAFGRYFDQADLSLADVFTPAAAEPPGAAEPPAPVEPPGAVDGVEGRVRSAYDRLARRPGGWVGLRQLRHELADVPRADLDTALVALYQRRGVSLIPEENQKALTADDHDAAVRIGGQHKHLIAIES